ncbi:MAG: prepilin-type N-terminal cleavage/methylation domain-containing protein [Planctomycetota bacterium]|nr:prepilin-type N-terminal cleavage/methylation domain-containing protein [Planctomycetota bacterium]
MANAPKQNASAPTAAARRAPGAGFSLIEVLLAMAILTIGIISVTSLFPVAAAQQRRAIDDTQGVIIGRNVLSVLRVRGTSFLGLSTTNFYQVIPAPPLLPLVNANSVYTDPSGTYAYSVAARYRNAGDPIDVAVFVYRTAGAKPASAYLGRIDSYTFPAIVPAMISTTNGSIALDPNLAARDASYNDGFGHHNFRAGDRNQLVLYVADDNTQAPFVGRVVKDNVLDTPPYTLNGSLYGTQIMSLPQRAVAIVTGTVQ